jgi:hypothetical protein
MLRRERRLLPNCNNHPETHMNETIEEQENQDPITHTPGAHPIGVGIGATVGGVAAGAAIAAGAASGTLIAGPLGAVVGAAVGAVAGALVGKGVAEHYEPTIVENHWRKRFSDESYYQDGMQYEDYAPAYQLAAARRAEFEDRHFDDMRDQLAAEYPKVRGTSRLDWDQAEPAARASWYHIYHE